jgi:phosphoribosylanthranilate isomerase
MSGARVAAARVLLTAPHASTLVKLCGMHRPEDVAAANAAGPDLVGFVVDFPRSHRSVPVAVLPALTAGVAPAIARVGVFVDEAPAVVAGLVASEAIDACQLHGHEDEAYLAGLRAELARAGVANAPVIQAFRVRERADVERAEASSADVILLDNGQGTGERFDWSLVTHVARPFILAGGLDPTNVTEAIVVTHPLGVDMSSGVETDGIKDEIKMRAAVAAVRSAR